jgi:hypothetical protein
MDMKSQIWSAYIAGLCPLQMLTRYGPDDHRRILPDSTCDDIPADLPPAPRRGKRTLLLLLTLAFAIGAWQLLSRSGQERPPAVVSAEQPASGKSVLLFMLIVGLTIGAGELLSHAGKAQAADVPAGPSASAKRIPLA